MLGRAGKGRGLTERRLLAVRGTAHVHVRGAEDAGRIAELGRLVTQRCPVAQTLLAAGVRLETRWELAAETAPGG